MWRWLRKWGSRVSSWPRMERLDAEFAEELDSHIQMLTDDHIRQGMSSEEARRQAMLRIGGTSQIRESYRKQRGLPTIEQISQDLRYAARSFRKSPAFTLFAGATLALGIAATTAVFSVANAVLLKPFPYRDASRLVMLWQDDTAFGFPHNHGSPWAFLQWKERNHVFEDMAALTQDSFNLTGDGNPEYLHANTVTSNFFSVLGVNAARGRTFTAEDGQPGRALTVVLSHGLWVRRFGEDASIVGRDVELSGVKYTVTGVMPRGFQFLDPKIDVWVPAQWTPEFIEKRRTDRFLTMVGRLRPGVSIERAGAEMAVLGKQLGDDTFGVTAVLVPLREQVAGDVKPALLVLLGAVAFVLLIACANLANLLLARGSARAREIAVREALGASRSRIIQQMLTESLLLSIVAGALGLGLAVLATRFLIRIAPSGISADSNTGVNLMVLCFTATISISTGVLFGILPAWRGSQVNLTGSLKQGGGQAGVGAGGDRLRQTLVVSEVALAMVLMAGAALMLRSFQKLYRQDPGFSAENVLTLQTPLPHPKYDQQSQRSEFYREVLQRVQALPGVVAAGYTTYLPLANGGGGSLVTVENRPVDPKHFLIANVRVISPGYFRALGMRLREGRLLQDTDGPQNQPVAVVNETMARDYWPGRNPIGQRFKRGVPEAKSPWYTVVGVIGDMRQGGMSVPVRPEAYFHFQQADFFAPDSLAIRTTTDPTSIAEAARQQIWAVDKQEPVAAVIPLQAMVDEDVFPARLQTVLLGGFGLMALLLSALGIYAVLSFAVTQRTQEIGVRVALGAQPRDVLQMVVAHGIKLLMIGLAIGITAALALSRLMSHLLFQLSAVDPGSYVSVALALGLVTLLACYLPARRAMKVDPMVALRCE